MHKKSSLTVTEASGEARAFADSGMKAALSGKKSNEDGDFYAVVVFQSKEQKDAFFRACKTTLDWSNYCDGRRLASKLGISLPAAHLPSKVDVDEKEIFGE